VRDSSGPEIAHRARGYTRRNGSFALLDDHPLNHIVGSGSIYSSVEDLARWDRALDTDTPGNPRRRGRPGPGRRGAPYGFG
jgi:hypothetical protein